MNDSESDERPAVTLLLARASDGDSAATEQVWQQMYGEIHRIARGMFSRENVTPTIQASVLISEAYLRLFGGTVPQWKDSEHFLRTVANSMSHFLIDHARARKADKRGGGQKAVPLTIVAGELADYNTANSIGATEAIEALEVLAGESPDAAEVARLRFLLGLSVEQTARVIGLAPRTVKKKWAYAKSWLRHRLDAQKKQSPGSAE
jgi:RNA polymerase sigma factor (TIGR02999 family)